MLVQAAVRIGFNTAFTGNAANRILDLFRRCGAGKCYPVTEALVFKREVQGMLGRAGPFPVAEDMQYFQDFSDFKRTVNSWYGGFVIVVRQIAA